MGFFDDMTTALATYPETDVTIEIIDVTFPGSALNTGEIGTFHVKVTNNGPLNLDGVTLRIKGLNGALVKDAGALAQFVPEFVTGELDRITGHGGSQTTVGTFSFKAPGAAQASRNLIKASLEQWDANLDHILLAHSDPIETVKGTFAAEVVVS